MQEWSRRQVLAALGGAAAAGTLACGGARGVRRAPTVVTEPRLADLRDRLRELVDQLERRFPAASGHIELRRTGGAIVDAAERTVELDARATAVFAGSDGERWFEQATTDLSADGLATAARALLVLGSRAPGRASGPAPRVARDRATALRIDPIAIPIADWLAPVEALYARTRALGGSRMVYRGAFVRVEEVRSLFIGGGRDLSQRVVRTRGGALFVAVTGATPIGDEVVRSGTAGLELLAIDDVLLAAGAERTLAVMATRGAAAGEAELLIDGPVAAMFAARCLAPVFEGRRARPLLGQTIGSPLVTLVDDPTLPGGYGSYDFDDEGVVARPAVLIQDGVATGALTSRASARALSLDPTGHARRRGSDRAAEPAASNLLLAAGASARADLIAAVDAGYLLEGGESARVNPVTLRFALRAGRAREISRGRLTGRAFAAVDVVGDLPSVLRSVRLAGSTADTIAVDRPIASSGSAPSLVARARLIAGGRA